MQRRNFIQSLIALVGGTATLTPPQVKARPQLLLLDTELAGFQYHAGEQVFAQLAPGQPLLLHREAHNTHDRNAVAVYWHAHKLGYIPRRANTGLAQMLDRQQSLAAYITQVQTSQNPWNRIRLKVCCET